VTAVRVLVSRLLDLVLRRRRDERLSEELQAHLDMLTDECVAAGMSQAEARLAARRRFGVVDNVKADYRKQRGLPLLDGLWNDARFGVRLLRRDRAFTVAAAFVLAVGIGVNNMLFTILYAHTLRGLPIPAAQRVLYLTTIDEKTRDGGISLIEFEELKRATRSFAGLAAFTSEAVVIAGDGRTPERVEANYASGNAFGVLGVPSLLGRGLEPEDDQPGRPAVGILGRGVWQSRYGADPGVLGRQILVNGTPTTVIGVVRDRSGFPSTAAIWLPLAYAPDLSAQRREPRTLSAFGRLHDDIPFQSAAAEVDAFFTRLSIEHPQSNTHVRAKTVPINEQYFGRVTEPAWLAFITAGFLVVLISAANVANLMLARGLGRTREIAIRTSLGATRLRVFRQLLMEGVVLAGLGGLGGLGVAAVGVRLFRSAMPENALPYWFDYSLDLRIVAALVSVSVLTVLIFAVLPAIQVSKPDVAHVLKAGGRGGVTAGTTRRWTTGFLAAEIALAVVLLAGLSVNIRTAKAPLPSDVLIETRAVVTGVVSLPAATYPESGERAEFYRKLGQRLQAVPGIASTSVASALPLSGGSEQRLEIVDHGDTDPAGAPVVETFAVGPRYFETLGLAMVRGREFSGAGVNGSESEAVVNERLAQQFFSDRDPIGQRIALIAVANKTPTPPRWLTIIGVAPDVRQRAAQDPQAAAYVLYDSAPSPTATVLIRGHQPPERLTTSLREQVQALDPSLAVYRVRTMRDVVRDAGWLNRISAALFLTLTAIAVGLSVVGVYAVAAHGVTRQTHEIGVRLALGAPASFVVRMILRTAFLQVAIGFFAGIGCTVVWEHLFSSGQSDVRATDPRSLAMVAATLVLFTCIACGLPATRATRLDPLVAIRHE
jgi:putative ABC transport system permease protein